jgi:UDP-N-acetylmuramate--alanine ligase
LGEARRAAGQRVVFYGLGEGEGWRASDLTPDPSGGMRCTVARDGDVLGRVRVPLLGAHNVLNALAALAVVDAVGVPLTDSALALESFLGTGRRSETLGEASGVTVISDYAHHPTAIRVTLAAHRQRPGLRHLWAVWQPHTYGRMRALADEFARAFGEADHVLVTDVYSVREAVTPGLDAPGMAERIAAAGHPDARCSGALDATADMLASSVRPGDVVVILSAGDAPRIGPRLLDLLRAGDPREV